MKSFFCVVLFVVLVQCSALDVGGIEETHPCVPLRTCGQCAYDSECGWCQNIERCLPGNHIGPMLGNCTHWSSNYCKSEPCSAYDGVGCQACLRDPFCGWCGSSQSCLEG